MHKQLQKQINFSLLGPVHHTSLSYFLREKNHTTKYGDDCFIFLTCHSQCLICLFKVQSLAVSMFPLEAGGVPGPDYLALLQWSD